MQFIQRFDSTITMGAVNKNIPGGSYVITYKDQVLASNGFGVRELNSEMPVDAYTVFRLGSVSKGFAAVLAGMMIDQGVLSFDDSVASILPYFRLNDNEQTARVRVRHLLEHTTGLPRHAYTNLVEDGLTLERIIPGSRMSHSSIKKVNDMLIPMLHTVLLRKCWSNGPIPISKHCWKKKFLRLWL